MNLMKLNLGKQRGTPSTPLEFDEASLARIEEMRDLLEETRHDRVFLQENGSRLSAEHPNKDVAVYRGELLGIYDTREEIRELAREMGIPVNRITTAYQFRSKYPMKLAKVAA